MKKVTGVDQAVAERLKQDDEALRMFADFLYDKTKGENISLGDKVFWRQVGITQSEASRNLRRMAQKSQGYLEHVNGADRTFAWTARAKEIKAASQLFINVQPITVVNAEDVQADTTASSPGPLMLPPLAEGAEQAQPLQGLTDTRSTIADGAALAETLGVVSPSTHPRGSFLPLFLAAEEIPVFQLLAEVSVNLLSFSFFDGLGLEGTSLDIFLAKMFRICVLANGPEVMGRERVFVFSKSAYNQHADIFFQVSTSAALENIWADLQQLESEQEALQEQLMEKTVDAAVAENAHRQSTEALEAAKKELIEARQRLAEAENQEKKAQLRMEEVTGNLQIAAAEVTATEQEIAAANLDNRIVEIKSLEETAIRLDQLHSPAYQQLLLSYLIIPVGKEA